MPKCGTLAGILADLLVVSCEAASLALKIESNGGPSLLDLHVK